MSLIGMGAAAIPIVGKAVPESIIVSTEQSGVITLPAATELMKGQTITIIADKDGWVIEQPQIRYL